ncbi:MAG TPA: hypothetical protein VHB77_22220, partial [Planctomycetaceae bacterium]|nr:hypothetical protein [Planctomycetaceae bacterium]
IVCSHTHGAGLLSLDRVLLPGGDLIPEYLGRVARTAARLIRTARDAAQPATIVYGTGRCALAAHRDYWDENGQHYVCGFNPGEPADETVLVARIERDDGRPLATVVNYACHPTTLAWQNTLISPDFPGALREMVAESTGAPCLFLQGASGELGPREGFVGDPAVADRNGRQLGYAVLSVLESLPRGGTQYEYVGPVDSGATIGVWQERPLSAAERQCEAEWAVNRGAVEVLYREDLRPISAIEAELAECETNAARMQSEEADHHTAGPLRARGERLRRELMRRRSLPQGPTFPWRADLWRMGDAVWLCIQGEPYSLLQTALRAQFPGTPIMVASIGYSWSVAYLPPRGSYGKGLYQESVAVAAPGSLEHTIDVLSDRIEALLNV